MINSPPEEEFALKIIRGKSKISIKLTPRLTNSESKPVQCLILKDKKSSELLAYIKLPQFYYGAINKDESLENKMLNIILRLQALKVKGIVLDLQNNGGGSFPATFQILSLFLNDGPVLQEKTSEKSIVHRLEPHSLTFSGKLLVLVNGNSASSSEILANALQERNRAVIIGSSTYGKGTIQEVINLGKVISNHEDLKEYANKVGDIKITRSSFNKLDGTPIHNRGVTPDIEVSPFSAAPKAIRNIKFPELAPVSVLEKPISELSQLKEKSLKRQRESKIFQLINEIKEEERIISMHEEWLFTNLNTMIELERARKNIEEKKKELKVTFDYEIVEDNISSLSLYKEIQGNATIKESIEILKDYVDN